MKKLNTLIAATLIVLPATLLTACTPSADPATSSESSTESSTSSELSIHDGWAKAGKAGGMTGVFGDLTNAGSEDLLITGVESADAGMIELHEVTAEGVMQEIKGDVIVPAKGTFELRPGANHIMLMDLKKDLLAGEEVTFTLHLKSASGTTSSAEVTVLVKDYAGANEEYGGAAHGEMDHGEMGHDEMGHGEMGHSAEGSE